MSKRKIGLEYEFLAIQLKNGQAVTRDIMKSIWRDWSAKDNVELYIDYATNQPVGVIYIQPDGQQVIVNTDAGINVVEFGFLPFETLLECETNMREIMKDFLRVAKKHNVGLLSYGIQPKTPYYFPDLKSEKIWYRGFLRFAGLRKNHDIFHNIAAHQPCIDVTFEELIPVLNSFNALAGIFIALFANSGWGEWKRQCCHEEREHRWNKILEESGEGAQFAGMIQEPFRDFKHCLKFNWDIPVRAIHRGNTLHGIWPAPTIYEYLHAKKWDTMDLGSGNPASVIPGVSDVNVLNMYSWIQARPKFIFDEKQTLDSLLRAYAQDGMDDYARQHLQKLYIETRNAACQSWDEIMALPAFLLGLIENIDETKKVADSKRWKYWVRLREKTLESSMEIEEVIPLAKKLVDIAKEGLKKRSLGEEKYLEPLYERIKKQESPSMKAIREIREAGVEKFIESRLINI